MIEEQLLELSRLARRSHTATTIEREVDDYGNRIISLDLPQGDDNEILQTILIP